MTYLLMSLPFLLAAVVVFAFGIVRARRRRSMWAFLRDAATTGIVLIALTIVFDNIMIAAGLFDYGAQTILGVRIGLVPAEDLLYPVLGTLLIAGLTEIIGVTTERRQHAKDS